MKVGGEEWGLSRTGGLSRAAAGSSVVSQRTQRSWAGYTQDSEISFDPVYMDRLVDAGVIERSPTGGLMEGTGHAALSPPPSGAPLLAFVPPSLPDTTHSNHDGSTTSSTASTTTASTAAFVTTPDNAASLNFFHELVVKPRSSGKAKEERRKLRRNRLKRALLKAKNIDDSKSSRVVIGKQGQVLCMGMEICPKIPSPGQTPEQTPSSLSSFSSTPTNRKDLLALLATMRAELAAKDATIHRLTQDLIQQKQLGRALSTAQPRHEQQQVGASVRIPREVKILRSRQPQREVEQIEKRQNENNVQRGCRDNALMLQHARKNLRKSDRLAISPRRRTLAERNHNDKAASHGGALLLHAKKFLRRRQLIRDTEGKAGQSPGSFGTPV